MAKERLVFMKNWYDSIMDDPNLETTEQEMAYILYAAACYVFKDEKINIGETFGKEFKGLNMAMPNIYSQIDNMKEFGERNGETNVKYDSDKIKELRLMGLKAKEICAELGYPESKAKSLTSNKGWIEANKILQNGTDMDTENTESVQTGKSVFDF